MTRLGTKPGEYFLLSRNGWAGTASHGAALWSGDISSTWDTLKKQVAPIALVAAVIVVVVVVVVVVVKLAVEVAVEGAPRSSW
jgi:hypothetical protein